jgi:protein TonB
MWYADPAAARLHQDRQLRMLYGCLCVSAALHGLAMLSLPGFHVASRPDDATVLTALFEPSSAAVPAPAPRRPRERSAEVPALQPPLPEPLEPAPAAAPQAAEPAPAAAEQPAAPTPVATAAPAEAPTRLQESVDPSLFDAYRLALINAAKRYKRYPVQAMERGWEGRVEIRLVVDANGAIKTALVKTSSRYQVLDDQALEMVRRAFNALAQVQPAPRGREFTVDVPVIFELQTG